MGREFELKYRANAAILADIQKKYGPFYSIQMKTAYYDTEGKNLSARRWTLRHRSENGKGVCTLKTPLPDGSRGEWETSADSMEAGLSALCKLDVPAELSTLVQEGLVQTCAATFTRLAATLVLDDATVELALDEGTLLGGGKTLPFAEVEIELKSGSENAAIAFATSLAREFSLTPELKSKHQRAMELVR